MECEILYIIAYVGYFFAHRLTTSAHSYDLFRSLAEVRDDEVTP